MNLLRVKTMTKIFVYTKKHCHEKLNIAIARLEDRELKIQKRIKSWSYKKEKKCTMIYIKISLLQY